MRSLLNLLTALGVVCFFNAEGMPRDTGRGLIREVLQEVNQNEAVQIELLKDCPEKIFELAEWVYQEARMDGFTDCLESEIPVILVAMKEMRPIGMISLETRESPDLADLENGDLRIGSLHVRLEERGRGIEELLVKSAALIANRMGYREVRYTF